MKYVFIDQNSLCSPDTRENRRFSVSWKSNGNPRFPVDTGKSLIFLVSSISMIVSARLLLDYLGHLL